MLRARTPPHCAQPSWSATAHPRFTAGAAWGHDRPGFALTEKLLPITFLPRALPEAHFQILR